MNISLRFQHNQGDVQGLYLPNTVLSKGFETMKSVVKLLLTSCLLLTLVSCGDGEEEIVYEESPYDIPSQYVLFSGDNAPAYYSNIMTYAAENAIVTELVEETELVEPPTDTPTEGDTLEDGAEGASDSLGEEGTLEGEEATAEVDDSSGASAENLSATTPIEEEEGEVVEEEPEVEPEEEEEEEEEERELTKAEEKALAEEEKRVAAAIALLQVERDREMAKLTSIRVVSVTDPTEAYNKAVTEATEAATEANGGTPPTTKDEEGEEIPDTSFLDDIPQGSYHYTYDVTTTGKSGGQVTSDYVNYMQGSGFKIVDPFHPVSNEYYEMLTPDFTQRAGTVALAKKASGTEKIFMILVDWHYTGAAVTVYEETGTLWIAPKKDTTTKTSLSITDVTNFLETRRPSDLGLEGSSMSDYNVFTSEGLVMVNGVTYRKFIISGKGTGTYGGTYLVDADGNTFTVAPGSSTLTPLQLPNIFDTF